VLSDGMKYYIEQILTIPCYPFEICGDILAIVEQEWENMRLDKTGRIIEKSEGNPFCQFEDAAG
jgi:hypothetical protein